MQSLLAAGLKHANMQVNQKPCAIYFWAEARGTGGGRGIREHMQIKDKTWTVSGPLHEWRDALDFI
ncbi:hypothetical protein NC652_017604 [Populus alba x Populus x berolinensis]|nr:hypothetical protein NC652_017604 [Populus alba x Populus x berolinensis]